MGVQSRVTGGLPNQRRLGPSRPMGSGHTIKAMPPSLPVPCPSGCTLGLSYSGNKPGVFAPRVSRGAAGGSQQQRTRGARSHISFQAPCSRGPSVPFLHLSKLQEGKIRLKHVPMDSQRAASCAPGHRRLDCPQC